MTAPLLFPGIDLAAFAVGLVARMRAAGVAVAASGPAMFVQALRRLHPRSRTELYWAARLTLVNRVDDLAAFDAEFDAVFGAVGVGLEPRRDGCSEVVPRARLQGCGPPTARRLTPTGCRGRHVRR